MRPPIAKRSGEPRREWGKPQVPKKEICSGARGELAMLRSKIEHCQLNSHPFRAAFSGIDSSRQPAGGEYFFNFILPIFAVTRFEPANITMFMYAKYGIWTKYRWWDHPAGTGEGGMPGGSSSHA